MCRNIRPLFNFDPVATDEEIQNASLQFVRKISGFTKPSKANDAAFHQAIHDITHASRKLVDSLVTESEPKNREIEKQKAMERNKERFGIRQ